MKNQNQAEVKTANKSSVKRGQKQSDHAPLPIALHPPKQLALLAGDPLAGHTFFEVELDWIGDTMEPEVFQGNSAMVFRREDMMPYLTELALGLLKTGDFVFGAFNVSDDGTLLRIDFINPKYPSVFYREDDFLWLYPVEYVSAFDQARRYRRIMKHIEFERGDDVEATGCSLARLDRSRKVA